MEENTYVGITLIGGFYVNDTYIGKFWWKFSFQNNHLAGPVQLLLREKFSPGPGFEPGSPAVRTGALINWASQTIHWVKLV